MNNTFLHLQLIHGCRNASSDEQQALDESIDNNPPIKSLDSLLKCPQMVSSNTTWPRRTES